MKEDKEHGIFKCRKHHCNTCKSDGKQPKQTPCNGCKTINCGSECKYEPKR